MTSPSQPPKGDATRELIARIIWRRFSPAYEEHFEESSSRSEYLIPAEEILALPALASHQATIERLTEERDEAIKLMTQYARDLGEMEGRYKAAHWPGIVDGWQARAEAAEAALERSNAALKEVRAAILEHAPDTLWVSLIETAVDCIDAALTNTKEA